MSVVGTHQKKVNDSTLGEARFRFRKPQSAYECTRGRVRELREAVLKQRTRGERLWNPLV